MAFEQLTSLTLELGAQAGRDADEAFNTQHALARDEQASADAIVASVKEQHRREELAAAVGDQRFVQDDTDDLRDTAERSPARASETPARRPPARYEDDDEEPPSWLS